MSNLSVLKPQEVVARLKMGFVELRQRGSHKQFRHADGRGTTIPFHKSRDISPILLRQIAGGTELRLRHRALGFIEDDHRQGVVPGWPSILQDVKEGAG